MSKSQSKTAKMSNIAVLKKCDFLGKSLSVFGTPDEPMFLAKEIAEWLEHTNSRMMLQSVDDDEKGVRNVYTLGGNQECQFLTEYGLYEVLMQSRKPIAKEFKKGVKKILKEIRQQGYYAPKQKTKLQQQIDTTLKYKGGINEVAKLSGVSVATLQGVIDGSINPPENEYNGLLDSFIETHQFYQESIISNDKHITDTLYLILRDYDEVNTLKERVKELESELATVQQKALPPSHTPKKQGISRKLHIVKQCTIVDTDLMLFADGNNQPWFLLNRLTSWFCRENTKVIKGAYLTRYISDKNKRQFNNPTPFSGGMKSWFVNPDGLNELFLHYDKQGGLDLQPYQDGIKQILSEY